ncbi:type IV pilus twitching motility protein PilT [Acerihabitans arboris]|uniref:PilT/PilU family type 4a pilus ATPase n=1 Tax=Acerihabitans arboris TaxID=2691583 RepID=A0A845SLV5_9GAMM|nr:PilT/PilU family type 4a pilus ATPase [Acerihabitans arboris]NDL64217.1 PilT/PilU family type 4a pilus ATPase [Acerihabitans arboris]
MDIDELVALSVKHNASDLHLCPGQVPILRVDGGLCCLDRLPPVCEAWVIACSDRLLDARGRGQLKLDGQADCAATLYGSQRLRCHFFRQRTGMSATFRLIPSRSPSLADLGIPSVITGLLKQPQGLLLVTGATGSGKSSSLAAMVDYLNQHRREHIITLEDPIEYIHSSGRSLIQQREIGDHCLDFSAGLRAAMRADPDVILLGELRDEAGIRLALSAAETGHLVLATLHARHAAQAVDRLVDVFPPQERAFVRGQLAGSLLGVMAQKLVAREQGGRMGLFELMIATPAVRNLIRDGKTHLLPGLLQTGKEQGMQTFEQSYRRTLSGKYLYQ